MVYIDGLSLSKIKEELKGELIGKKVGKITQETDLSLSLSFGKMSLVISCAPSLPIIYLAKDKVGKLDEEYNFIFSLRKYFSNAQLVDISQVGYDRILILTFKKLNELGEVKTYKLHFELMGKHSNLIITDKDDTILDLIKRSYLEESAARTLFAGVKYSLPFEERKILPNLVNSETFPSLKEEGLGKSIEGLGKLSAKAIVEYLDLERLLNSTMSPKIYIKNYKINLATVLDGITPVEYDEVVTFSTYSEMIEFYLEKNSGTTTVESLVSKIVPTLRKKIAKLNSILVNIDKDDIEKSNYEEYKNIGDILAANIYSIPKYSESVNLYDFYSDKMIDISLDKRNSIQKNIESYYKKYNKLKRGLTSNKERRVVVQNEIDYLKSVETMALTFTSSDNLKAIAEELVAGGYLKQNTKVKKVRKNNKKVEKYGLIEEENFQIFYGRNNLENDYVTFKIGDKEDYWFHIKDIPGPHVILKCNTPSDELLLRAATVAIEFSKLNSGDRGIIEYTKRKFVTKPNGSKPGFVIYTNQKEFLLKK